MHLSIAATQQHAVSRPVELIKCRVMVTTESGTKHSYPALFDSTIGAIVDAIDRFGNAKVHAEAMR